MHRHSTMKTVISSWATFALALALSLMVACGGGGGGGGATDGGNQTPEWSQQAYIKSDNNNAGDEFGNTIAIYNDTLAVGAHYEDSGQTTITINGSPDNSSDNSGAVYVFTRSGTTWSQQAYIKADNADSSDYFGSSIALYGDTLAVGAFSEDSEQTTITINGSPLDGYSHSGAVYVFTRSGTTWSQQAYIKADNNNAGDAFGISVALYGDTLAVGAWGESSNQTTITINGSLDNSNSNSGAVYIFTRSGITWSQQAYIKTDNNNADDTFGRPVKLYEDTLAVGAIEEDSNQTTITINGSLDNSNTNSGAVYIFTRTGTTWTQQAFIKADNSEAGDEFGWSIGLHNDTLAVGIYQEDSNQTTITINGSPDNSNSNSGAVYIFTRTGTTWSQQAYIKADNNDAGDCLGYSVAIYSDILAVGACYEESNQNTITINGSIDNSNLNSGAVYIFTRTGTTWSQQAYIKADNNDAFDRFGFSVSLYGTTLAVGAYYEDSNQNTITINGSLDNSNAHSGAVYVYTYQ